MAKRYANKLALLAKIEGTYGTDSTPAGSTDAMLAKNVTIDPLLGTDIDRNLIQPYLGNRGIILAGNHVRIAFDIEMAGAGGAGDVPAYGPLLRACGLAETVTADTKVEYTPVSSGFESVSLYYVMDGVRHIGLGARGRLTIPNLKALALGHFHFEMMALLGTITDQTQPTLDHSGFVTPVPIGEALTSLSLFGATLPVEDLSVDLGNDVQTRFLINATSIDKIGRSATGSCVIEAASMATKDWFALARAGTTGVLAFQHGTTAGNIVGIDAPVVQLGRPTQGATQNIVNYTLPLNFLPDSGNDELVITIK